VRAITSVLCRVSSLPRCRLQLAFFDLTELFQALCECTSIEHVQAVHAEYVHLLTSACLLTLGAGRVVLKEIRSLLSGCVLACAATRRLLAVCLGTAVATATLYPSPTAARATTLTDTKSGATRTRGQQRQGSRRGRRGALDEHRGRGGPSAGGRGGPLAGGAAPAAAGTSGDVLDLLRDDLTAPASISKPMLGRAELARLFEALSQEYTSFCGKVRFLVVVGSNRAAAAPIRGSASASLTLKSLLRVASPPARASDDGAAAGSGDAGSFRHPTHHRPVEPERLESLFVRLDFNQFFRQEAMVA